MIQVVRSTYVDAKPDVVGAFLSDVTHLTMIEPKLDRVIVKNRDETGRPTRMRARARFGLLRFWFDIDVRVYAKGGFKSGACSSHLATFSGGFSVRRCGPGTLVTHVERYVLKPKAFARWLGPIWRSYIARSMEIELGRLRGVFGHAAAR